MRAFVVAMVLLVAAPAVVGCLGAPAPAERHDALLPDLSDLQEPAIDAARARSWWEKFVTDYPERQTYTPTNFRAGDQLAADLTAAGYQVSVLYYTPQGEPSPVAQGIRAIVGVKAGATQPDHVLSWVAHYDSNKGTAYAAYDDGSGTAVALELARVLAKTTTNKTLMPIFFDAEEQGLLGSQYFVAQMQKEKRWTFDLVIGHDMTGINCPGYDAWPMYQMTGENFADLLVPIEVALYRDQLHLDVGEGEGAKNCVVVLPKHDRNSDERHFKEAGIPILRMAGGRNASDYPAYHQVNDTVDYVYQFAGGKEAYEKGLALVVRASWWNIMVFDRLPPLS